MGLTMRVITEDMLRELWTGLKEGFVHPNHFESLMFELCTELNPWQPIDSAPKDRPLLIYDGNHQRICLWIEDNQAFLDEWGIAINAQSYQELPEDPEE